MNQEIGNGSVQKRHGSKKWPIVLLLIVIIGGGSFYGGFFLGSNNVKANSPEGAKLEKQGKLLNSDKPTPAYLSKDVDFQLLWQVWSMVKKDYIQKDTSDTKLFYGALAGIVGSLGDPYSVFFDPETYKKFSEDLSGSFDGIGAEIGMKKNDLAIIAPLPGTPAEKAGLKAGDRILAIDKVSTSGMALDQAVNLIRGKKGTEVTLTIYRDGESKERNVTVTRDTITVKSVTWEMKDSDIAYIKISHFNQDTADGFADATRSILGKKVKGIIIDLRNDPGGYLDTAISVAGYWVDAQTVVIEKYNDSNQKEYKGDVRPILKDIPTVVLVNKGSASASEIVAGALQDYKKATLVGETTFGKGSVQDLKTLKDGSAIKLTIAKWLTPKGRSINEQGITPDIAIEITDEQATKKQDPQLDRAMEIIKGNK